MLTAKQPSNSKDTGGERNSNTPFFSRHTIQAKLQVNEPGDSYEREADAMADHVMRMTDVSADRPTFFKPATSTIQRKCQHCEDEEMLHRKESSGNEAQGSNELDGYVSSLKSSGTALPETSRSFFEPRFGHDFSNVRIHTDSVAAKSAQSINALAYTTGNNIVFNSGQYSPGSDSGKRLMAHELTHVVQQGKGESIISRKKDDSCSSRYKDQSTEVMDTQTFEQQVKINVNSWTPYLIQKIGAIINETFSKKEQIGWLAELGTLAIEGVLEVGEKLEPGIKLGLVFIKALIGVCREAVNISEENSLEKIKETITTASIKALVSYQGQQLKDGNSLVSESLKRIKTLKGACNNELTGLRSEIDEKFPAISEENFEEIKEIAEKIVRKVTALKYYLEKYKATGLTPTQDRQKQYEACKRQYLPYAGVSEEAEAIASEKCYSLSDTFPFEYESEADSIIASGIKSAGE